jgi:hypothetical protein
MPELQSLQDAQNTVATLFKVSKGTPETILDDYAKIAWFLTQKSVFENALTALSLKLWNKYREYQSKNAGWYKNLFTSTLRDVSLDYGWRYESDTSVVLVGAVSDVQYTQWVTQGLFLKTTWT